MVPLILGNPQHPASGMRIRTTDYALNLTAISTLCLALSISLREGAAMLPVIQYTFRDTEGQKGVITQVMQGLGCSVYASPTPKRKSLCMGKFRSVIPKLVS